MKKLIILFIILLTSTAVYTQDINVAPPVAPYRPAVWADNTLYISGQIGINPSTKEMASGDIDAEIRQVMDNLGAILKTNGLTFDQLVSCTVYLTDMKEYGRFNDIYKTYFTNNNFPARVCVQVAALPKNARVEISGVAVRNKTVTSKYKILTHLISAAC